MEVQNMLDMHITSDGVAALVITYASFPLMLTQYQYMTPIFSILFFGILHFTVHWKCNLSFLPLKKVVVCIDLCDDESHQE